MRKIRRESEHKPDKTQHMVCVRFRIGFFSFVCAETTDWHDRNGRLVQKTKDVSKSLRPIEKCPARSILGWKAR